MVAADTRTAMTFCLSSGQTHDVPEGRHLPRALGATKCVQLPFLGLIWWDRLISALFQPHQVDCYCIFFGQAPFSLRHIEFGAYQLI